jgi:hypothetical protein
MHMSTLSREGEWRKRGERKQREEEEQEEGVEEVERGERGTREAQKMKSRAGREMGMREVKCEWNVRDVRGER